MFVTDFGMEWETIKRGHQSSLGDERHGSSHKEGTQVVSFVAWERVELVDRGPVFVGSDEEGMSLAWAPTGCSHGGKGKVKRKG